MNINFSKKELIFQKEVRTFLKEKYSGNIRKKQDSSIPLNRDEMVRWQKILYERGWAAVNWPVEYGGTGWTTVQKYIFENEIGAVNAPEFIPFGVKMVGPIIYSFGNNEQKRRFLPDILSSDVWWCQGYSEPGSGSDLASLQTRALADGDDYIVNGSKIWTTMAQRADWIFCLVRTSTDGKRQEGITFLLMPMDTPGITVEPIVMMDQTQAPDQEVNQVFFEDVRIPQANRIGDENDGWTVAKYLLEFERGNAYAGGLQGAVARVKEISKQERADGDRLIDDPAFAAKLAQLEVSIDAIQYTELRTLSSLSAGERVGSESSILKCQGSSMTQSISELMVEATAYYALPFDRGVLDAGANVPPIGPDYSVAAAGRYFNQRKATIYGGSNEVQHEIIAKRILGM